MIALQAVYRSPFSRNAKFILVPIAFLITVIWILFISDQVYSRVLWDKWKGPFDAAWDKYQKTGDWVDFPRYTPPIRWGSAFGREANGVHHFCVRAFIALVPDTFHLPIHIYLLFTSPRSTRRLNFHPIYSLVTAIIFTTLWCISALMSLFTIVGGDYDYPWTNSFDELVRTGAALQFIVFVLYFAYIFVAAKGVHEWRVERMSGAITSGAARREVQDRLEEDERAFGSVAEAEGEGGVRESFATRPPSYMTRYSMEAEVDQVKTDVVVDKGKKKGSF